MCGLGFLLTVVYGGEMAPLHTIESIRRTPPEQAAEHLSVELESQVIQIHPLASNFFLYDGNVGIFVRATNDAAYVETLKPGDRVRVLGVTTEGGFVPDIIANRIERLGHEAVPIGNPFYDHQFYLSSLDSEWVKIRGRLINMTVYEDRKSILLEVLWNEKIIDVKTAYSEYNEKKLSDLLFQFIDFQAVAGTVFNENRQAIGRIFYATSADDFWPVPGGDFGHETEVPIHELMRFDHSHWHPIRTRGVVTSIGPQEIYLRGEKACLRVAVPIQCDVEVGDEALVSGFAWPQRVSPAFRARSVKILAKQGEPKPVRIHHSSDINALLNYEWVELDAELVDLGKRFQLKGDQQPSLLCRKDGELFEVRYPADTLLASELKVGCMVRLHGICQVERGTIRRWYMDIDGFWIQLHDPADVVVLVPPRWWTVRRLLWSLGLLGLAAAVFLGWIVALKRTVAQQTFVIGDQVKREAVLKERQRIARELHDNLAQGLVGMLIQLKSCVRGFELNKVKVNDLLPISMDELNRFQPVRAAMDEGLARGLASLAKLKVMMDRCSEESRSSILYLRSGMAGRMGLMSTLQEVLEPLAEEVQVVLSVTVAGEARALDQDVERNLMLVTKEAVTNALRHAQPSRISVELRYGTDALQIKVTDDGSGFLGADVSSAGHYGLVGMRERMSQLGGDFELTSAVGAGTEIVLQLSSIASWEV